jgi:hypothetical protein
MNPQTAKPFMHVCLAADVDEATRAAPVVSVHLEKPGIRTALLGIPEFMRYTHKHQGPMHRNRALNNVCIFLTYGIKHPCRGRKRKDMNVDKMVEAWSEAIIGLATAHDKQAEDKYEAATDDLMAPLLTAPVKQLRELYAKLLEQLKNDPRCPYVMWRSLEQWGQFMVVDAEDEAVIKLKENLAREVVALCEQDVLPQFPEAMVRALMWRPEEQLEAVKAQLTTEKEKTGATEAKIKGRESCLFLEVGRGKNKAVVQL